jgi:hypothetical protein
LVDADHALDYELRDNGVVYRLADGVALRVQLRGKSRQRVSMERAGIIIPPETGDLGTSTFRKKLVDLATERFGEANGLAEELGLIAIAFESHLGEREEAAEKHDEATNAPELIGTPYRIVKGGIVRLKNTREGEVPQKLTNFVARVDEEVVRDDGAETRRIYKISGEAGRKALGRVEVPAASFGAMNWVSDAWGLASRITAGQGSKDHAREAIELLSDKATTRRMYAHTGWREMPGGELAYLHAGGAIGAEGVEVELEPGLERYAMPDPGEARAEDLAAAVQISMGFLDLAPLRVTAPLLAAAYLAPLSEITPPDFALWLWGATGSYKSTLAALLLSHFGRFSETSLPLSFESTSNALERSLFLLKDMLAVVDDWRPGVSHGDAAAMDTKAQRLLRAVGNRQGRGRMTSDTTLRRSYAPRGVVMATAEALPEGPAFESAAARSLSVNVSRGVLDVSTLSTLQHERGSLAQAMSGYVRWIGENHALLRESVPAFRERMRAKMRDNLTGAHPRTPDTVAALRASIESLRAYAVSIGVDKEEAARFQERAAAGIVEAARAHAEATKSGDPATRFLELLRSLFAGGNAYARHRDTGKHPPRWEDLGWEDETDDKAADMYRPRRTAEFVGWADGEHLYLDKEASYAAVAHFAGRGGIPFGIKPRALWDTLKRAGLTVADEGRTDTLARVEGRPRRIVRLHRAALHWGES